MRLLMLLCLILAGCAPHGDLPFQSHDDEVNNPQPIYFDQYLWRAARETVAEMTVTADQPLLGVLRTGWAMPLGATSPDEYRTDIQLDYNAPYAMAAAVTVYRRAPNVDPAYDPAASVALQRTIGRYADELRRTGNVVN